MKGLVLSIITPMLGLACATSEFREEPGTQDRPTAPPRIDYEFVEDAVTLFYARDFDALEKKFRQYESYFENEFDGEPESVSAFASFRQASDEAREVVEEWVSRSPDSYVALLAHGNYFEELGWRRRGEGYASETTETQFQEMEEAFRQAIPSFEKAAKLRPKLTVSYAGLLDIYRALGEREEMDRWLARGLDVKPASYTLRYHYAEGLRPRWGGSIEEMEAFAAEAQKLAEANPRLRKLLGLVKSELGEQASRTDQRRALVLYEESLAFGEDSFFLYRKALAHDLLGEYDAAIATASRALERAPAWIWAMVLRANLREKMGDREGALDDLGRALRIDSDNPSARSARAHILLAAERFQESLADVERALSVRPYSVNGWNLKSWLLSEGFKDEAGAREAMERAAELGSTQAQLSLGWRYLHGPEPDHGNAYRWLSAAADGGNARAMCELGVMHQKGNFVRAEPSEAARLYYRAARRGFDACRHHLGLLYLFGHGVEQDIVRGYVLIASAAQIGDKASVEYMQEMESRMRPEELEQGRRRLAAGDDGLEEPPR